MIENTWKMCGTERVFCDGECETCMHYLGLRQAIKRRNRAMSDNLISREALQQEALKLALKYSEIDDYGVEVYEMIEYAPAVDAVPVVKCTECKYEKKCNKHISTWEIGDDEEHYWQDRKVDFCGTGERKE